MINFIKESIDRGGAIKGVSTAVSGRDPFYYLSEVQLLLSFE